MARYSTFSTSFSGHSGIHRYLLDHSGFRYRLEHIKYVRFVFLARASKEAQERVLEGW